MIIDAKITQTPKQGMYDLFLRMEKGFYDNLDRALAALAPRLADRIRENIDMGGARGEHEAWEVRKNPTPLLDTGELYNSIEGTVEEEGDDYVIVVGTDKAYAKLMNDGGIANTDVKAMANPGNGPRSTSMWIHTDYYRDIDIPKREFMFLASDDAVMMDDTINTAVAALADIEGLD